MDGDERDYNYDWILGYGLTGGSEIQYSGYPYGPDSLVFSIGSEYYSSFGLSGGLSITFIMIVRFLLLIRTPEVSVVMRVPMQSFLIIQ